MWKSLINILPRGNTLDEADWQRRHRLLQWVLLAHVPVLAAMGVALGNPLLPLAVALVIPVGCAGLGRLLRGHRRLGSAAVTGGLVWCSTALVGVTGGSIEAHFHFFIIIGFIALYQDWVPFLLNVMFTVISHGVGSMWLRTLMFNHQAAQANPWLWSLIHGVAVLLACVGVMLFWRVTEDEQNQKDDLTRRLADAEINRRRFTSDMLVNLARRNQTMLYRQLEIINQLEESERNPDALADLFRLDHLTTRVRRNAENLLVLSGEKPPRVWSQPVPLRDVVRAAIAETEDLDRVVFEIPEGPLVDGSSVTDVTHLLAELTENAVRFSPPDMAVTIRSRRDPRGGQGQLLTVEDWGVGIDEAELTSANALLTDAPEIDLSVSRRLGFYVVARLAARHGIRVVLSPTPGSGVTASVTLPGRLFEMLPEPVGALPAVPATATRPGRPAPRRTPDHPPAVRAATAPSGAQKSRPERREPERRGPEPAGYDGAVSTAPALDAPAPAALDGNDPTRPGRPAPVRNGDGARDEALTERIATQGDLVWVPDDDAAAEHTADGSAADEGTDADPTATDPDHAVRAEHTVTPIPRLPPPGDTAASWSGRPASWKGWWSGPVDAADAENDGALDGALDGAQNGNEQSATHGSAARKANAQKAGSAGTGDTDTANGTPGPDMNGPTDDQVGVVPAPAALVGIPTPRSAPRIEQLSEARTDTPARPMAVVADPKKADESPGPRLRRRVPQASLAPGLRVIPQHPESDAAPPPSAAEALSRYQASRAAARSVVEDDSGHERTSR